MVASVPSGGTLGPAAVDEVCEPGTELASEGFDAIVACVAEVAAPSPEDELLATVVVVAVAEVLAVEGPDDDPAALDEDAPAEELAEEIGADDGVDEAAADDGTDELDDELFGCA